MSGDSIADFLTFVSPICILVLFFMCFFRFLFRSCECGSQNDDIESCPRDSRPSSSSTSRVHPCHLHSDFEGFSGPYGEIVFCPAHCEESFPPKYEDALKMAACGSAGGEVQSSRTPRPSMSSPPPVYSEAANDEIRRNQEDTELPPYYSNNSGQISSTVFQPILRVTNAFRRPELSSSERSSESKNKNSTRLSLGEIEPHLERPATSHSRRGSLHPPRVPLPGAVEESDDESESTQPEAIQRY